MLFSNPYVMGVITLTATGLSGSLFWPRSPKDRTPASNDVDRDKKLDRSEATSLANPQKENDLGRALFWAAACGVALALAIATAMPSSVHAETEENLIQGTYLTLTSITDSEAFSQLRPGVPVLWQVGVSAQSPDPGTVNIGISAQGPLAEQNGLDISIISCTKRWVGTGCAGAIDPLISSQALSSVLSTTEPTDILRLLSMPSDQQRWLAITLTLPSDGPAGSSAELRIYADGAGDTLSTDSSGASHVKLPEMGTPFTGVVAIFALMGVTAGTVLAVIRRSSRARGRVS